MCPVDALLLLVLHSLLLGWACTGRYEQAATAAAGAAVCTVLLWLGAGFGFEVVFECCMLSVAGLAAYY
jgi:hypothetical protein